MKVFLLLLIINYKIIYCCILSSWAADWAIFYGAANPPATYGGTGGTTRKLARYSFAVPPSFTEDAVSKVDKGASGIDTRFLSAGRKKASITVITLRNEGSRDGGGFVLKDADSALRTVAGANYALQDAIGSGSVTSRPRPGGFAYEIEAAPTSYAIGIETSSVSDFSGRASPASEVALFCCGRFVDARCGGCGAAGWAAVRDDLQHSGSGMGGGEGDADEGAGLVHGV